MKPASKSAIPFSSYVVITIITLVGGSIYQLPYLSTQYYEALLEALHVSNTELGLLVGIYGLFNLILYVPGGFLADRFSYRKLVVIGGMATAILGLWYALMPDYPQLMVIHAAMSISSTFIFWAAMIKAVNNQGSRDEQGRLFGFQSGSMFVVRVVLMFTTTQVFLSAGDSRESGIRAVILFYSVTVGVSSMLVSAIIKEPGRPKKRSGELVTLREMISTLRYPRLWLCGFIVFFHYLSVMLLNYVNPYMVTEFGQSDAVAANVTNFLTIIVVIGSFAAGYMADKIGSRIRFLIIMFVGMIVTGIALFLFPTDPKLLFVFVGILVCSSFFGYAIKAMYFATLDDIRMPKHLIGSASAVISLIGYLPDTFLSTTIGAVMDVDKNKGYELAFIMMIGSAIIGFALSFVLLGVVKRVDAKEKKELASQQGRAALEI